MTVTCSMSYFGECFMSKMYMFYISCGWVRECL